MYSELHKFCNEIYFAEIAEKSLNVGAASEELGYSSNGIIDAYSHNAGRNGLSSEWNILTSFQYQLRY